MTQMVECTKNYLPEEYMKCWGHEMLNQNSSDLAILHCFKKTLVDLEYNQCLREVMNHTRERLTPDDTHETCTDLDSMKRVAKCMEQHKRDFKVTYHHFKPILWPIYDQKLLFKGKDSW